MVLLTLSAESENRRAMAEITYTLELYQDAAGEWRWRIVCDANGETIAASSERYVNRCDCVANVDTVLHLTPVQDAPIRELLEA